MRVKIGEYKRWHNVIALEDKYFNWRYGEYVSPEYDRMDYFILACLSAWQTVLNKTVNKLQQRRERKIKVHIDDHDLWSVDETLSHVILPTLIKFNAKKDGGPYVDPKDVPKELRGRKLTKKQKEQGQVDDKHFERWDYILDAMIWSFSEVADGYSSEEDFFTGVSDIIMTPVDAVGNEVDDNEVTPEYYRMDVGPNDTQEIDWEGMKKYRERVDYGLLMFGKYYTSLWS